MHFSVKFDNPQKKLGKNNCGPLDSHLSLSDSVDRSWQHRAPKWIVRMKCGVVAADRQPNSLECSVEAQKVMLESNRAFVG